MNMLLAQSLDAAMSEGLGIIAKFLFIVAVIVIALTFFPILGAYYLTRSGEAVAGGGK